MPAFIFEQIQLPKNEMDQIRAHYPKHMYDEALRARKAVKYIEQYLVKDKERSKSKSVGRCCSEGDNYYSRKDGQPITEEDLAAMRCNYLGQVNAISVEPDGKVIKQHWLCDSGD